MTSATARVPADLAALGQVHGALAAALASEGWAGEPASPRRRRSRASAGAAA